MVVLILQNSKVRLLVLKAGFVFECGGVIGGLPVRLEGVVGVEGGRAFKHLAFPLLAEVKVEFRAEVLLCHLLTIIIWNSNKICYPPTSTQTVSHHQASAVLKIRHPHLAV